MRVLARGQLAALYDLAMPEPLGGCRIDRVLLSACRHNRHDSCVHLVDDVEDAGALVIRTERVLHVCTCPCHASCAANPDLAGKSVVDDGVVEKDRCSCWESRHVRQLQSGDHSPAADPADAADDDDDGRQVSLGGGMSVSPGCLVVYPFFAAACVGAVVGAHYSHGYVRDVCWLLAGLFGLLSVPMTILLLIGGTSKILPGRYLVRLIAGVASSGLGILLGAGVAAVGPADFAVSAVIALVGVQVFRGYGVSARIPRRARRLFAGYVFWCGIATAITGAAILAFG